MKLLEPWEVSNEGATYVVSEARTEELPIIHELLRSSSRGFEHRTNPVALL